MPFGIKAFDFGPFHYEPKEREVKTSELPVQNDTVFGNTQNELGSFLSATVAYYLFAVSDCVHSAISLVADEFSQIRPVLQDKVTKEYVLEHPALELLETNDLRFNETQVKKELMISYMAAGESFPVIGGNVKYEPVSLYHYPANVCSISQGGDGYIQTIMASYQNVIKTFNRAFDTPIYKNLKTYVFETEDQLNQMMHIVSNRRRSYLRAQSDLESVYYQALMKYYTSVHNSSIVQKASRPSALWSPAEGSLTQEEFENFKRGIKEGLTGPVNAGRQIISPSAVNYQNLILSARDMDFLNLIKQSAVDVYNTYRIPLPLVTTETMTMSNYTQSIFALYDLAILPKAKFLFKNLGDFILARYKDGSRFRMVIDDREIPALKQRLLERGQSMRNIYAFTEDEIRAEVGYVKRTDGQGDTIYIPANYVPSGKNEYEIDPLVVEDEEIEPEPIETQTEENREIVEGGSDENTGKN